MADADRTEVLAGLRQQYEEHPEQMSTNERALMLLLGSANYFEDWDRYSSLMEEFRGDVQARITEGIKIAPALKADSITPDEAWDHFKELFPDELEDLVQQYRQMDLLEGIYRIRGAIYAADPVAQEIMRGGK